MINIEKVTPTGLFTNYIYKAIPLAFDESMSYYETLCGLLAYLKDTVIPALNNNADAIAEVQVLMTQLQNYVNNYFDNLDVQEEINTKLDEMAESGVLEEIMADYLDTRAVFGFDSVADMKLATNLTNGSFARTLGYSNKNDGNGAMYKIRTITNEDIVNEINIIALADVSLIAELIVEKEVISFNNVADMKANTSIWNGNFVQTMGYYSTNDGGGAKYKIRTKTNDDVVDEGNIIAVGSSLVAELINDEVNVKQFGAYGDNTHDDTTAIQNAINYCLLNNINLFIPSGIYLINTSLTLPSSAYHINIEGENTHTTIIQSTSTNEISLMEIYGGSGTLSKNYIKNICFKGVEDATTHNHINNGLHIKGKCDLLIQNCIFTNFNNSILLENSDNNFTEYVIADNCLFNHFKNCMRLKRTGTQQSFHGCGLRECFIQENSYSEEVLYIGNGCQLYNGYLDFKIWINSSLKDSLVYLDASNSYTIQTRELLVIGNIRYEGNIKKYLFNGNNVERIVYNGSIFGLGGTLLSLTKLPVNKVSWSKIGGVAPNGGTASIPTSKIIKSYEKKTVSATINPWTEANTIYHAIVRLVSSNVTQVIEMDLIRLNTPELYQISNKSTIQSFNQAGIDLTAIIFTLDSNGLHIALGSDNTREWDVTVVLTTKFFNSYEEYGI